MEDVTIEGERVYLRSITRDDTGNIVKWRNQENVKQYFFYRGPFNKESHERWLTEKVDTGIVAQFIVCQKEDDRPIGCTYLRDIDYDNKKAEYGVFLGEEGVRGKGIGKEILKLTLKYAFENLELHRVYARVREDNMPSLCSFLNCGFEKEALLRESVYCDGKYLNVVILGIINENKKEENRL